jgi:hypothetical protein
MRCSSDAETLPHQECTLRNRVVFDPKSRCQNARLRRRLGSTCSEPEAAVVAAASSDADRRRRILVAFTVDRIAIKYDMGV